MNVIPGTQDGGVSNLAVGTFVGDGTIANINCGFLPRSVQLINLTDVTTYDWLFTMAANHSLKCVAAGTMTDDTAAAVTPKGAGNNDTYRGFAIAAAVNITGKTFHFIAQG